MTESKMKNTLLTLANTKDYAIFYLIDTWQMDQSKRVREIIKVSDIYKEFEKKEGRFYKKYKINSHFKDLLKAIEKKEEFSIKCYYEDTYKAFMKKWKEDHPGENYNEFIKKEKIRKRKEYIKYMGTFGLYGTGMRMIERIFHF